MQNLKLDSQDLCTLYNLDLNSEEKNVSFNYKWLVGTALVHKALLAMLNCHKVLMYLKF